MDIERELRKNVKELQEQLQRAYLEEGHKEMTYPTSV